MKKLLVAASLYSILIGCKDDPEFPNVPRIETVSFQIIDDEAFWKFSFTDGDGDLGSSTDTNYYQSMVNLSRDTTIDLKGEIIPEIEIVGGSKGIEGEITKNTNLPLLELIPDTNAYKRGDMVYFNTYIVDKTGNKSNVIRTPAFIVADPSVIFLKE